MSKGQGIIEYIILMATVIAALMIFLRPGGVFERAYQNVVDTQTNKVADEAVRIFF